ARPVGRVERLGKWARRHPAVATLLVALVLVTAVGFALVAWQWRQAVWQRKDANNKAVAEGIAKVAAQKAREAADLARKKEEAARQDADTQKDNALRALRRAETAGYGSLIALTQRDLQDGFIGRAAQS